MALIPLRNYYTKNQRPKSKDIQLCNDIWPALKESYAPEDDQYARLAEFAREQTSLLRGTFPQNEDNTVVEIVNIVRGSIDRPREDVLRTMEDTLGLNATSSDGHKRSTRLLELATSLWLTTHVRCDDSLNPTDRQAILWEPDRTLRNAIERHSASNDNETSTRPDGTIDECLTISNLVANYGFEVDWTNNIYEHLTINWKTRVLSIYQHKIWLHEHIRNQNQCPIPGNVIKECLDTLNLLFPHHDSSTRKLLKNREHNFHLLGNCGRQVSRDLQSYPHWGQSLDELLQVLKGPRKGFRQLLPRADQENLIDSINFWIAVFVAALTVVSFVFGLSGVIYAKMSYDVSKASLDLSRQQYLLSLAQACSDPSSSDDVLQFC